MKDRILESFGEIYLETGGEPIAVFSGDGETSPEFCGLEGETSYKARVRYKGERFGLSEWSDFKSFKTPSFIEPKAASVKCGFEIWPLKAQLRCLQVLPAQVKCGKEIWPRKAQANCGNEIWPLRARVICKDYVITLALEPICDGSA